MTLHRQLLLFTLILCFFLFVGVWIYKLQTTRIFLQNQLEVHAQDTSTSLALSLSPLVGEDDMAAVETMMNAIFDRGYYREIAFFDIKGATVVKRSLPITVEGVPDWFIGILPINTPGGESLIMAGWKRAGTLYVESHPGYAYQTLWQTFVRITGYFFLTGVIVFAIGSVSLNYLLRPLRRLEEQADAICRREYNIQEPLPKTRELKRVVTSMNKMTDRVKEMFEEQSQIAEKLRENAYEDTLTGLGNRRFLQGQIDGAMAGSEKVVKGVFLLVQLHELKMINEAKGYSAGDELLVRTSKIIDEILGPEIPYSAARIAGGDFGIFLPDADRDDGAKIAAKLAHRLAALSDEGLTSTDSVCNIGGVNYSRHCSFSDLLAKSDRVLAASRHEGPNRWHLEPADCDDAQPVHGKVWWRKNLEQSLAEQAINLYGQHVVINDEMTAPLHLEIYSRITIDEEREVTAGVFIPLAERVDVITQFDRKVMELVLDTYQSWEDRQLAVNLSVTSLLEPGFVDWILARIRSIADTTLHLFFEFSEISVVRNIEAVAAFSRQVKNLGHDIGIDHFGRSFSNFGYLKSLQPEYVKIDRSLTKELESGSKDSYFFIGSLRSVAHSLDIKVIGEGVENEVQYALFKELRVDGFQGYLVEQPVLLTTKPLAR